MTTGSNDSRPLLHTSNLPPLFGDGHGRYKVKIVGNSGAGKSTLGAELSAILGVPQISLDELFWLPGWETTPPEEFKLKVRAALDAAPQGWVVDGNYDSRLHGLVDELATDVIWLDPPFALYFPRIIYRTFGRLLGIIPPCRAGCSEDPKEVFFSRNSIIWWCITHHRSVRQKEETMALVDGVSVGGKRRRIGGWGRELREWKENVKEMVRAK